MSQMLARLDAAIDELKASGEFCRIADAYALPVLINQTDTTGFACSPSSASWRLLSPAWCWLVPANTLCSAR